MLARRIVVWFLLASLLVSCSAPPAAASSAGLPTATPRPTRPPPTATPTPAAPAPPGELTASLDPALPLDRFHPGAGFTVFFSQAMDPASSAQPLYTYPYLPGKLSWDAANAALTFQPEGGFAPGQSYELYLDRDLRSTGGARFAQVQRWRITTLAAPRLTARSPAGPMAENRRPLYRLTFDHLMDSRSVEQALTVVPSFAFSTRWEGNTLAIQAEEPLQPGQGYRFTLGRAATDSQGVPLAQEYSWSFQVMPFQASLALQPDGKTLTLRFNYALITGEGLPFQIEPAVNGAWSWVDSQTAAFAAGRPFDLGVRYAVTFTAPLKDSDGQVLPQLEPLSFAVPPPISRVSPQEGDSRPIEIAIHFTRPMDHHSTEAAFQVEPPLPGRFEWQKNALFYLPDQPLTPGARYTFTLNVTARDAAGQAVLLEPYIWSFTLPDDGYAAETGFRFGISGPNAQVLDASGRRAIQFSYNGETPARLIADLYRLDLSLFIERYRADFASRGHRQRADIDLTGLERFKSWGLLVRNRGVQELLVPGDVPTGLYILRVHGESAVQADDRLFLVLTRNALVVKRSAEELFVWASDINGAARPGLEIGVYDQRGENVAQGWTDEKGIYRATLAEGSQPLLVVGRGEGKEDITLAGLSGEWSSSYDRWDEDTGARPGREPQRYAVYTYTDRPIYQPGQVVYFKSIWRVDRDLRYALPPADTPVTARLLDGRENTLQTLELRTNAYGTVNGQFSLPPGAMLGDYSIEVRVGEESHRQAFKVQDYHKPDFQVQVSSDAAEYVNGDTVTLDIDVRYLFGEPLVNTGVSLKMYRLSPDDGWQGDETVPRLGYRWTPDSEQSSARTDGNGHAQVKIQARMADESDRWRSWRDSRQWTVWGVEVTADDGSGQAVSGYAIYKVYHAAQVARLELAGRFQQPGRPFTLSALLTDLQGQPAADQPLHLKLDCWNRKTRQYDLKLAEEELRTGADGKAQASLVVRQSGDCRLTLTGEDGRGNSFETTSGLVLFSQGNRAPQHDEPLRITADRQSYKPSETARFLIESTFSGPALLTFERGRVSRSIPLRLTAPRTVVEAQLNEDDAPNVFVTINAWQDVDTRLAQPPGGEDWDQSRADSHLQRATVELQVEMPSQALQVTLTPDRQSYAPLQEAKIAIQVNDPAGQPVQAELSVALVDEAVFSLNQELAGPIVQAFYGRRARTVQTTDSLALTRYLISRDGRPGGEEAVPGAAPGAELPDTAFWLPAGQTDENGQAQVAMTLPDSLTVWRVVVKAVTRQTQVGEASVNILTQQEVAVRPLLPRRLVSGDRLELAALVHNNGQAAQEFTVALAADGLELQEPARAALKLTLQPGQAQKVQWAVTAGAPGQAQVQISAQAVDGARDTVRLPLEIAPRAVIDEQSLAGVVEKQLVVPFTLPGDALELSYAELKLSRSLAGSLWDGLEYLTGYPYGCVEQTMSKALSSAVVGRALRQLGVSNPGLEVKLPALIEDGVQRLYAMQHEDGGWGWWTDDDSDAYQTAWVVYGLALTAEGGYPVEKAVIERGAQYLAEAIGGQMDERTRAYVLYSLAVAGYGQKEASLALADRAEALDAFGQAALALALARLGEPEAAQRLLELLAESAAQKDELVYWPLAVEDGQDHARMMPSATRSTALALAAFVRIDSQHPLIPGMVRYLMGQRRAYGWGNTHETAFVVLALSDYLLAVRQTSAEMTYQVRLNGQELANGQFPTGEDRVVLRIPFEKMRPGVNQLEITCEEGQRLYYTLLGHNALARSPLEAEGSVWLTRRYLDAEKKTPLESLAAGQLVLVELEAALEHEGSFILVEDQLPGGLEALNESLNMTSMEVRRRTGGFDAGFFNVFHWADYGYNQKEIRAGKVTFFIVHFPPGKRLLRYYARALQSGTFTALPAQIWAMYDETVRGRSASAIVEVE